MVAVCLLLAVGLAIVLILRSAQYRRTPADKKEMALRQRLEDRVILRRETQTLSVHGRDVRVKVSSWQDRRLNVKPEFADVCRLAEELDIPVKQALLLAQGAVNEKYGPGQD